MAVLTFCEINDNAPSFCLVLSEAHLPCETPNIACFAKLANGWIQSTTFAKSSILDVWLGSKYVSEPDVSSIEANDDEFWIFHESFWFDEDFI